MNKRAIVIGGGMAGCEEGLALAWQGKDVSIVEMKEELAKDAPYIHWKHLLTKLEESTKTYRGTKVVAIEDAGVRVVDQNGNEQLLDADTVLIATGMRGTSEEYDSWHDLAEDVVVVGDCRRSAKVLEAMRTGYCAGMTI